MANLIVFCAREADARRDVAGDLRRCASRLAPDNIRPHPPVVQERDGLATVIVNPVPGIAACEQGVCLGRMFGRVGKWWETGTDAPDGNFVIARHDERQLEVLTDVQATRQLWYVHTPDLFAASTSQRALVMLLRSFELDQEAVSWMLSAGHLGGTSWDRRLRRLRGDCRLVLDRRRWRVDIHERPAILDPLPVDDAEHIERFRQAVLDTCASLGLPLDEWLLPLSGGLDSRLLLLGLMEAGERPRCVTWGLRSSLLDPENDAFIAREIAQRYGLEHSYRPTDGTAETMAVALRRFVVASEGQVCDFGAYTDGMAMWKAFFEEGVAGMIRGDEPGLGYWEHYDSEREIMRRKGIVRVSDYPADHPIRNLGTVDQRLDPTWLRGPDESLTAWDVRTYGDMSYPLRIAPLNTVKTGYLEIVNPLQSTRVTEVARRLPDHLRIHRKSLEVIVAELGPDLPIAKAGALGDTASLRDDPSWAAAIVASLSADGAERVLSRPGLDLVLANATTRPPARPAARRLKRTAKGVAPRRLINWLRPFSPPRLSGRELAFRAYIAVETADLLAGDADLLRREDGTR